ncbi:uncharacterized protein TRUGW13939_04707 [Talaromyces rugulosus]|uniref:Uncharacterized protein n=1 Tax=Talaromyces rugulosus TaxID=121627 RepID=A0A7H8QUE3_TALRU|nr:uncharacterized protein TRUGW13939_04707 [Talaromyces rugulosus]QKX57589.1 hypothetical protein TRUGW13939_04707 [Talaromyces rugulosus]
MSSEQPDLSAGLSSDIWKILEGADNWGANATEVQKLERVKNFQEPFKHTELCLKDNSLGGDDEILPNNPHMHLEDLRYGVIGGLAASKPSVWLIVRHAKEPKGKSQIGGHALFQGVVVSCGGSEGAQEIVSRFLPVVVHSIAEIETDTYVLLGMHEEIDNEILLYPWIDKSLEDKEFLIVRLKNSKALHQHCNWTSGRSEW